MARLQRLLATIERLGSGPAGLRRLAIVVVVLLGSVALQGLQLDDLWHRSYFHHDALYAHGKKPWWAMFTFFDGDPSTVRRFRELGMVPWWSDDHVRLSFFRPLSCLTHALDYTLWPNTPAAMHLHSLAWYVALVLVAALLYRRVLPPAVSALAALLYAVNHNHGGVAGWIANRNALICAAFAFAAVLFHDRASRGEARARWIGAAFLALGLLSGEGAVGAAGYLAAHALVLDTRPWRERARDLAPHAAVLAGWVVVYKLGHYGASGSGLYLDPGRAPLRVLAQVPEYTTLLIASEWGSIGPESMIIMPPEGRTAVTIVAVLTVIAGLFVLAPRLRTRPSTRFLLLGGVLAVLPCCATGPATRLLLVPGLGLLGVVAEVLADFASAAAEATRGARRIATAWFALWVGGGHLLLSPLLIGPMAWQMVLLQDMLARFSESFPPDDPALPAQRLVSVGVPDSAFAGYIPLLRATRGWTVPRGALGLTTGTRSSELRRVSEAAVEVTAPGGFYQWGTDLLERDLAVPMPVGTRFELSDVTIEVLRTTPAGVPDVARFTFAGSVTDARYRWVKWQGGKYVPFDLPAIGATVAVAAQKPGS